MMRNGQEEKWSFSPQNSPPMKSSNHSGVGLLSSLIHALADSACTIQAYWPNRKLLYVLSKEKSILFLFSFVILFHR